MFELLRSQAASLPSLAKFALGMAPVFGIPPLARRVRLPGVVGLLLGGVVIGPHGFGIFAAFKTFDPLHQPLIDHRMLDVVLILMVTTAILGPVLTQYFAPRLLEHVDHESRGRGWKGGQPG